MRRLLAWLGSLLPADPNLDRSDRYAKGGEVLPRRTADALHVLEPPCALCPRPVLQDGLCGGHGGLPWFDWPGEKQARLNADIEGKP